MTNNYNISLIRKARKEYQTLLESMNNKTPQEVVTSRYELVMKEEFLICLEQDALSPRKAKALNQLDEPLEFIYQEWLDNDYSFQSVLKDTIDDAATKCLND